MRWLVASGSSLLLAALPALACGGPGCGMAPPPSGPHPRLLLLGAGLLLLPALLAYRRPRAAAPWAEALLVAAAALPLAFAGALVVRVRELDRFERVALPWDMGLAPAWLSVALSCFAAGALMVWARRRGCG